MKKLLGVLLSLVLLISLSINVTSANSEPSPIAKYDFDNDSGTSVIDSVGSNDGTNRNATYVEGWNGQGKAINFNGTTSYIQFNQKVIPVGKKSIRFKIKTSSIVNSYQAIMINAKSSGEPDDYGEAVYLYNGDLVWWNRLGGSGQPSLRYSLTVPNIADNQWHDILFTWDGTTNTDTVKIYKDDMRTPIVVGTAKTEETKLQSMNLSIGYRSASKDMYYTGQLDELEIYNEVIEPIKQPETIQSKLFVGNKSAYKLTIDGEVYAWGENSYGQLGLGDTMKRTVSLKEKVNLPEKITNLVMGQNFVIALGESGTVYGWGDNASGVLADGEVIIKSPIVVDTEITDIFDIN